MSVGYVYILSNPTMNGLLKIGYTCNDVEKRAKELSISTGVPVPFVVEHYQLTQNVEETESKAHEKLSAFRVNENREFFRVSVQVAIEEIRKIVVEPSLTFIRKERKTSCRRCGHLYLKVTDAQLCPECGF